MLLRRHCVGEGGEAACAVCVCSICSLSCPVSRNESHGKGTLNMEGEEVDRPALFVYCTTLHWEIMLREHTFWGVAPRQPQPKSCQESEDLRKAFTQLFDALCPGPGPGSKSLPPLRVGTYSRASSRTCMINRNLHARARAHAFFSLPRTVQHHS